MRGGREAETLLKGLVYHYKATFSVVVNIQ